MCVHSTEQGIRPGNTLADLGYDPTEEEEGDSPVDVNSEILSLERRDFGDEEGIILDVVYDYYHSICCWPNAN